MKKFFAEFKKFVTRGNVVDMAVGVIVGSSFTAIVNALSNNILKPFINFLLAELFGANSLKDVYTFLKPAYVQVDGVPTSEIDLANSIYIDWGAFINAVINFFLIAFVLFVIVKLINGIRDGQKKWAAEVYEDFPTKEDKLEMKKQGIKLRDRAAVKAYMDQKQAREAEEKAAAEAAAKAEAEEKARLDRIANPTAEDLLKEILAELRSK